MLNYLSASAAASEFYMWVYVGIDVCIPHCRYQAKLHSSLWFSTACAGVLVYRNHFFCLYQQNKSSESKVKFPQASNVAKGFLKLPNLHMPIIQKSSSLPRNLSLGTFGEFLIVLNKGRFAIPPLFSGLEVLFSAPDKATLFAKKPSKNSNLDVSGISLPVFPSRTNLKLHNMSITLKMAKKVP